MQGYDCDEGLACTDGGSLLLASLDVVHDLIKLHLAHDWPLLDSAEKGVAHLAAGSQLRCLLHKFVVDVCSKGQ